MSTLALRRVIVQPEFVLIDGDKVTDVEHPAVAIPADEWPTYSSERFPREVAAWQAQIDAETAPKPNRAARRAKAKS
jgi:hypothetical protein